MAARTCLAAQSGVSHCFRRIRTRRHPEDSHPSRAPHRSGSAPTTAGRPVRLELIFDSSRTPGHRCRLSRGGGWGVSARRCLATDHRPVGFPTAAPAHGRDPCGQPGPPIVRCVVTEQVKTLRMSMSEMGAFCKPSRKRPFIAPICPSETRLQPVTQFHVSSHHEIAVPIRRPLPRMRDNHHGQHDSRAPARPQDAAAEAGAVLSETPGRRCGLEHHVNPVVG